MKNALVIGGGFGGCLAAQLLVEKKYAVTLVEQASFLGGGCKTFHYGGHPFTYGPRHFLTQKDYVWEFLNKYVPMRRIPEHEFLTYVERDQSFYHFPIHKDEISDMPDADIINQELAACSGEDPSAANLEEFWVSSVGPTLYSKFVESYSKKMWQIPSNTELDVFNYTTKGVALKEGGDKACWTEAISAFPEAPNGYDDYFELATQGCNVLLGTRITDFDIENYKVQFMDEWHQYDVIINTISPEIVMKNAFGPLRWMGRDFFKIVLPVEHCFPKNVYFLYYANQEPFTRIVEYKKFYRNQSKTTLIALEIPSNSNKLYPFTTKKDQAKAQVYQDAMPERVFNIGRAASYRYLDVGNIIEQRFELAEKL